MSTRRRRVDYNALISASGGGDSSDEAAVDDPKPLNEQEIDRESPDPPSPYPPSPDPPSPYLPIPDPPSPDPPTPESLTLEPPHSNVEEELATAEDAEEVGKIEKSLTGVGSTLCDDTMSDDGGASVGSSEGSSLEDPDEDSPPQSTASKLRKLDASFEEPAFDQESDASDNESDYDFDDTDPSLYFGAAITLNESLLSILTLAFTHNLSRACLDDVLQLVSIHCPPSNLCTKNLRMFKKHFSKSKSLVSRQYYCTTCFESLKSRSQVCGQCNQRRGVGFFIRVPILPQLKALYGRKGFHQLLLQRLNRNKHGVSTFDDIYDGQIYKHLMARGNILAEVNNISFSWYTSGIKVAKSSDIEIWPFYLTINELPFIERSKQENVVLGGIWFGPRKPVPHLFLKGIREDFHSLNKGVQLKVPEKADPILVRGIVICGTCDLSAKALFLNLSHHTSTYGCAKCKVRSVKENNQGVFQFQRYPPMRTYDETIDHAQRAIRERRSVYGVKGTSALSFVHRPIETTAIDMHDAYIGISKLLNKIHFSEDHHKHPASLFGFLQMYDRRLCAIRPPYYVEKLPRPYSSYGSEWDAAELKVNLMMYSLPLFQDIMSVYHFEHHMLLVYGLYLLNKDFVSEKDIESASEMLTDYCSRFQDLYGNSFMTSYVHQLIHLPSVVKDFGPLWVTSSSPFERLNETLRKYCQGNQPEDLQVTSAASLFLHVSKLKPVEAGTGRPAHVFCQKLSQKGKKIEISAMYGHYGLVGKLHRTSILPEVVYVALAPLKLSSHNFYLFDRILNTRKSILFSSIGYDEGSKNISSCVRYQKNNGVFYGRVHTFLRVSDCDCDHLCSDCNPSFFAIMQKLHVQPAYRAEPGGFIPFIHRCAEMIEYEAVRVECLSFVCFLVEIEDRHDAFIIEPITTGTVD